MPPITLNRRRFLGCSAAAGLALSQGRVGEGADEAGPVRLGVIGLGTRGTSLLRTLLELPEAQVVAVCDAEPKHRLRGQGIVEKARGPSARGATSGPSSCSNGPTSTPWSSPCRATCMPRSMRRDPGRQAPLRREAAGADGRPSATADRRGAPTAPELAVHVGFQRRSNPRYREGVR